jgi:hypothetical protein
MAEFVEHDAGKDSEDEPDAFDHRGDPVSLAPIGEADPPDHHIKKVECTYRSIPRPCLPSRTTSWRHYALRGENYRAALRDMFGDLVVVESIRREYP